MGSASITDMLKKTRCKAPFDCTKQLKVDGAKMTLSAPDGTDAFTVDIEKGDWSALPAAVQQFVGSRAHLMRPSALYICDGTQAEAESLIKMLVDKEVLKPLTKLENCYLCRTDPADVARVEAKTFIVTRDKYDSVPHADKWAVAELGKWMSPDQFAKQADERYPRCMTGRTLYVIPFSMGVLGSPMCKVGVQVTDSAYVAVSMRIMTRVSLNVLPEIVKTSFVPCTHTVGHPLMPGATSAKWPCAPARVMIAHIPAEREIWSFGSGYGGNSLLGKKCFALRIACVIARDEGWLAEHMLIMGITPKSTGTEVFVTAAFPSACGKTNMAMLQPAISGYEVKCVGDDIAWLRFDDNGALRAINPEAGFFGVAPGTSYKTNPMAMDTFQKNSMFTNVAETSDGCYYWEGLEDMLVKDKSLRITDWLGKAWEPGCGKPAAHPNSRFTTPASQCPIIHPKYEAPEGVPVSAIIFGGRRPKGVPLVFEARSWAHGVFVGACLKSETTAASMEAAKKGKKVVHDPMAMRPFLGYNFGKYLNHWLSLEKESRKMPRIYHVNWFRTNDEGKFLWPGFGENIRVLDWIIRRATGDSTAKTVDSPVGLIPAPGSLNIDGLDKIKWNDLFDLPKDYWTDDVKETSRWFNMQVGEDLPEAIRAELKQHEERIAQMS